MSKAVQAAAPAIKEKLGIDLQFQTQGGSTAALNSIGQGAADLAMVTRAVSREDRSAFPKRRIFDVKVGAQALVPIVSRETWDAGVQSITRDDFVALYEGDMKTWDKSGAKDLAVKFFNPEKERGVWELFAGWLYGDVRRAPLGKNWPTVTTHQEARDTVEFTLGSISLAPPRWADGKRVKALPLREADGTVIEPTMDNCVNGTWPISRPLHLATGDKPTGNVRKVFELLVGPLGQEAFSKADFIFSPTAASELSELLRK